MLWSKTLSIHLLLERFYHAMHREVSMLLIDEHQMSSSEILSTDFDNHLDQISAFYITN